VYLSQIAGFDAGYAPRLGIKYNIERNDRIHSVQFAFTHLSLSTTLNLGTVISSEIGRSIRAAIWISDENWSLANSPFIISSDWSIGTPVTSSGTGAFNTNTIPTASSISNLEIRIVKFNFNAAPTIYADHVIIGLVSDNNDAATRSLSYIKSIKPSTLYYIRDTSNRKYKAIDWPTSSNGLYFENSWINIQHFLG